MPAQAPDLASCGRSLRPVTPPDAVPQRIGRGPARNRPHSPSVCRAEIFSRSGRLERLGAWLSIPAAGKPALMRLGKACRQAWGKVCRQARARALVITERPADHGNEHIVRNQRVRLTGTMLSGNPSGEELALLIVKFGPRGPSRTRDRITAACAGRIEVASVTHRWELPSLRAPDRACRRLHGFPPLSFISATNDSLLISWLSRRFVGRLCRVQRVMAEEPSIGAALSRSSASWEAHGKRHLP